MTSGRRRAKGAALKLYEKQTNAEVSRDDAPASSLARLLVLCVLRQRMDVGVASGLYETSSERRCRESTLARRLSSVTRFVSCLTRGPLERELGEYGVDHGGRGSRHQGEGPKGDTGNEKVTYLYAVQYWTFPPLLLFCSSRVD